MRHLAIAFVLSLSASNSWSQCQYQRIESATAETGDLFGYTFAVSGPHLVVGSPQNDDFGPNTGKVSFFELINGRWTNEQFELSPEGGLAWEGFGDAVAIDGDLAVVGAYLENGIKGAAYLFRNIGGTWTFIARLTAPVRERFAEFGKSVAVQGDTVVCGAPFPSESGRGAVYVFREPKSGWGSPVAPAVLSPSTQARTNWFGYSVDLDDDVIVVGAPKETRTGENTGAVYLYEAINDTWVDVLETAKLSGSPVQSFLGFRVAVDGNWVAASDPIGSLGHFRAGGIFLWENPGDKWTDHNEDQILSASNDDELAAFARGFCLRGSTIFAGARLPYGQSPSGSVYKYTEQAGIWGNERILHSENLDDSRQYGTFVAASDGYLFVGDHAGGSGQGLINALILDEPGVSISPYGVGTIDLSGTTPGPCESDFVISAVGAEPLSTGLFLIGRSPWDGSEAGCGVPLWVHPVDATLPVMFDSLGNFSIHTRLPSTTPPGVVFCQVVATNGTCLDGSNGIQIKVTP